MVRAQLRDPVQRRLYPAVPGAVLRGLGNRCPASQALGDTLLVRHYDTPTELLDAIFSF